LPGGVGHDYGQAATPGRSMRLRGFNIWLDTSLSKKDRRLALRDKALCQRFRFTLATGKNPRGAAG